MPLNIVKTFNDEPYWKTLIAICKLSRSLTKFLIVNICDFIINLIGNFNIKKNTWWFTTTLSIVGVLLFAEYFSLF